MKHNSRRTRPNAQNAAVKSSSDEDTPTHGFSSAPGLSQQWLPAQTPELGISIPPTLVTAMTSSSGGADDVRLEHTGKAPFRAVFIHGLVRMRRDARCRSLSATGSTL